MGGQGTIEVPSLVGEKTLEEGPGRCRHPLELLVGEGPVPPEASTRYVARQVAETGSEAAARGPTRLSTRQSLRLVRQAVPSRYRDLVRKTQTDAATEAVDLGLTLDHGRRRLSGQPLGPSSRQDPAAGTEVKSASTVTIWVSSGPSSTQVKVPRLSDEPAPRRHDAFGY